MGIAVAGSTNVVSRPAADLFFSELSRARARLLLLDYDGTIAPFSVDRSRAFPYSLVPELLDCIINGCRTRVVVISGRPAREVPPLLGLDPHPEIWGSYAVEHLYPDGRYELAHISGDVQHALAEAEAWLQEAGLERLLELKPGAIAVHWRGLDRPRIEEVRAKAYGALSSLAGQAGLVLAEFDGGLELRLRTLSKGDAVRTILSESGDLPVAYLGDDNTDEEAFRALHARGLSVLVRPTYRFTAAQVWLRPPQELIEFLLQWVHACRGEL